MSVMAHKEDFWGRWISNFWISTSGVCAFTESLWRIEASENKIVFTRPIGHFHIITCRRTHKILGKSMDNYWYRRKNIVQKNHEREKYVRVFTKRFAPPSIFIGWTSNQSNKRVRRRDCAEITALWLWGGMVWHTVKLHIMHGENIHPHLCSSMFCQNLIRLSSLRLVGISPLDVLPELWSWGTR